MVTQPYISLPTYNALRAYIMGEANHRPNLKDHPKPSFEVFSHYPAHGSVVAVEHPDALGIAEPLVGLAIFAKGHPEGRNPRWFLPTDAAAILLTIAFGMPLNVIDNKGKEAGLSYPRFRPRLPKGQAIPLLRVLADAQRWEEVEQRTAEGDREDYHILTRRVLTKRSIREAWKEGKQARIPKVGRPEFFKAVELYWVDNHPKAGIDVPLEEYLSLIRLALNLGDHPVRD